jgi:hypothetical protein
MPHPNLNPQELEIEYRVPIAGYFFSLRWDGDVLIADQSGQGDIESFHEKMTPAEEDWQEFWHLLDEMEIWDWYELYQQLCMEGDEWKVIISYDDQHLESEGANSYPSGFREFFKALEELTGIKVEYFHEESTG